MSPATGLWIAAGTLVVGSILSVFVIMGLRWSQDRYRKYRHRALHYCRRLLLGVMIHDPHALAQLPLEVRRADILAHGLMEIAALIKGRDRDNLVSAIHKAGGLDHLVRKANRGSLARRMTCLEAVAFFPLNVCRPILRAALKDPHPDIRLIAVGGLIEAGATISPKTLIRASLDGHLPVSLRFMALLHHLVKKHPGLAIETLTDERLPLPHQLMLCDAIGSAGDYGALPILCLKATSMVAELRAIALNALGRLKHPGAELVIGGALDDPDWRVRRAAVEAIGQVKFRRQYQHVATLLADPVWAVRAQAVATLEGAGDPGHLILRHASRYSDDSAVRDLAASSLHDCLAA